MYNAQSQWRLEGREGARALGSNFKGAQYKGF